MTQIQENIRDSGGAFGLAKSNKLSSAPPPAWRGGGANLARAPGAHNLNTKLKSGNPPSDNRELN